MKIYYIVPKSFEIILIACDRAVMQGRSNLAAVYS